MGERKTGQAEALVFHLHDSATHACLCVPHLFVKK